MLSNSTSRIISDFVQKINQIKPFWIHNTTQSNNRIKTKAYERFLSTLSIKMKNIVGPTSSTIPNQKVPERISIDYHDFLLTFPQLAVNFIENYYNLSSYSINVLHSQLSRNILQQFFY